MTTIRNFTHFARRCEATCFDGEWKHNYRVPITFATKRLAALMDAAGIPRKERGKIRNQFPMAHRIVKAERLPIAALTLAQRVNRYIVERTHGLFWQRPAGSETRHYFVRDRKPDASRLALVVGDWFFEYSRRAGTRHHVVAVLTGFEDGQWWARRVSPNCRTVDEALVYIRPAEVNAAIAEGREVRRQGDVWLVSLKSGRSNFNAIHGTDHRLDGVRLVHPQHGVMDLSDGVWKAFLSKDTTRPMVTAARYD